MPRPHPSFFFSATVSPSHTCPLNDLHCHYSPACPTPGNHSSFFSWDDSPNLHTAPSGVTKLSRAPKRKVRLDVPWLWPYCHISGSPRSFYFMLDLALYSPSSLTDTRQKNLTSFLCSNSLTPFPETPHSINSLIQFRSGLFPQSNKRSPMGLQASSLPEPASLCFGENMKAELAQKGW